jgi:hypothetical protein
MAQPQSYTREKNFLNDNSSATDHAAINSELDDVSLSINGLRGNLALIQSDDGALSAGVVDKNSLSQEVLDLVTGASLLVVKGDQGDVGPSFNSDYFGLFADRHLFDEQVAGYSFLALDEGKLYLKLSDTSGDWSQGYTFGRGEKGEKGDAGAPGVNGTNGTDGLITSVELAVSTVSLIGKSQLSISLEQVGGKLQLKVEAI